MPHRTAEGITAKSGPQIDQSDCAIWQNIRLPYNKKIYLLDQNGVQLSLQQAINFVIFVNIAEGRIYSNAKFCYLNMLHLIVCGGGVWVITLIDPYSLHLLEWLCHCFMLVGIFWHSGIIYL